jgi:phospholipid/cholesterol/gamma-HCH transport system substrate-binding protein
MAKKNLIVGLFVLAALALFTVSLFLIGNRHEAFSRHMDFYTEFTDLAGLTKGTKVQVAGMDAGQVIEIDVPDSPSSRFRVRLRIDEKLQGLVRTDSLATIGTEGVVGNTFVSIGPGSPQAAAAPSLATLRSKEPIELADLLDQAKGTIADVDGTVKNANGLLTTVGGNLNQTLFGARTTLSNVNDVVVGLKEGRGSAGMLLRDQALAGQIRETVGNVQQASLNLNRVSAQANGLLTDIQSRSFPQKIDETLASVKDTASNFDASSQQIRQTVNEFTAPDQFGVSAGINLRDSLSNVNAATGNMADDTEALKHNFFFRPFFRQRGYYNLSHITPDEYRKDHLFANPTNRRVWLPANELFSVQPMEPMNSQRRVVPSSIKLYLNTATRLLKVRLLSKGTPTAAPLRTGSQSRAIALSWCGRTFSITSTSMPATLAPLPWKIARQAVWNIRHGTE